MLQVVDERGSVGVADEMLPKLLGGTTRRARPSIEARVRALIEANSAEGLRRAIVRLRDRPDASPQLANIRVPVLVIVGEEDAVTPVDDARAIVAGDARRATGDPAGGRPLVEPREPRVVQCGAAAVAGGTVTVARAVRD